MSENVYQIDFNKPESVHFIGIGGISMSGLAEILMDEGFTVSGSDSHRSELTDNLEARGAEVYIGQKAENIQDGIDVVVYTAAIHPDNPEFQEVKRRGIPMLTRAELLGEMMRNYKNAIAIAGTHGKTTTTSMVTEIFLQAKNDPTISVGGILPAIGGNIRVGGPEFFVTEACEYTNSFLSFFPTMEIILNIEADHLDFFKDLGDIQHSFRSFAELVPQETGHVVANYDNASARTALNGLDRPLFWFSLHDPKADCRAEHITWTDGLPSFDIVIQGQIYAHVELKVGGEHNICNALAAASAAYVLGLPGSAVETGLAGFTGAGRLMQRPQEIYAQLFERQGLRFEQNEQGITIFGRLCPGTFTLPGNVSSQFISGLLFATPLMEAPSTIEVRAPFESRSYVDLTTDAMQKFGVKVSVRARKDGSATYKVAAPQHYAAADMDVEGDYSQAAFLAVLGSTVGGITITGLPSGSHQGDRVILDILKQCGAKFERSGSHVTFHRSLLKAVEIDLADCPDLGPVLIALGCFCSGTTIIRNAGRLRIKECDRIAAMQEELAKMGGTVKADGDTLTIEGCALHKPTAPLNGHNDHRIVMAMAVAALAAAQPAVIEGANAVNKSWPDFFEVIKGLGAHVTNQG